MHSFIVTGADSPLRQKTIEDLLTAWKIAKFDRELLSPEGPSIGIAQVRRIQPKLALKPSQSENSACIIYQADLLTLEAQQAMLKTLEEPPRHVRLILEADTIANFLPTILSRCQLIDLGVKEGNNQEVASTLAKLQQVSWGERLKIIDSLAKTKEEALAWTDLALAASRETLRTNPELTKALMLARQQLAANVNPKLVLDLLWLGSDKQI